MPLRYRLCRHADYQHAYAASRKQFTKQITYFFASRAPERRSETAGPRIGLTVPKALGKAHDRNRIKRRMRAAVRANVSLLTAPVDLILHPRRSVIALDFALLTREISAIFRAVQTAQDRAAGGLGAVDRSKGAPRPSVAKSRPPAG